MIDIFQQNNWRDSRSYPASPTVFSKYNAKTPHFSCYAVSDPGREQAKPSGVIITDTPCPQTSSHKPKLVFMCSGTSTSPAIRLFLPFAASNWRTAHPCKPLACSSTAIVMPSCEPGPTLHYSLCFSGVATRARDCQTAASRCFYGNQQIPRDDSRTWDRKRVSSALKNYQRRYKSEENEKFKAREGHEDLHIASSGYNSVSFKVLFTSLQTPAQVGAIPAVVVAIPAVNF